MSLTNRPTNLTRPGEPTSAARPRSLAPSRAATERAPRASAVAGFQAGLKADDFAKLCEVVRSLCGVDLTQYKRAQMERRVRPGTRRRGTPALVEYGARLRRDP